MTHWKTIYAFAMAVFLAGRAGGATINLAALIPAEQKFQTVLEEIRDQAGPAYHIDVIDVNKKLDVKTIARQCASIRASGLILMDTKAVNIALELQKCDSAFVAMPKFVFMTLQAEMISAGLFNAAGITFEVPFYTLVTNFRIISEKDFSRVGIFYRKSSAGSIEETRKLLDKEQITVSAVCIDCDQNRNVSINQTLALMKASGDRMAGKEKVEVFIVPADNLIVNPTSLAEFWNGKVHKMKIPVIAAIDLLASEKFGTAVFTADPDLTQLGSQAANQIIERYENNLSMNKIGFEPTISIKSTLNMHVAGELGWRLKKEKLGRITNVINY